jgi:hypothetical protein
MIDQEMTALLRRIRHDFGNHLQVISGYLQIERPAQALDYLGSVVDEMNSERVLFDLPADAALYFYSQLLRARDAGMMVLFKDIDIQSWESLKAKDEPYQTLAAWRQGVDSDGYEIMVELSLHEDQSGYDVRLEHNGQYSVRLAKE